MRAANEDILDLQKKETGLMTSQKAKTVKKPAFCRLEI